MQRRDRQSQLPPDGFLTRDSDVDHARSALPTRDRSVRARNMKVAEEALLKLVKPDVAAREIAVHGLQIADFRRRIQSGQLR